MSTLSHYSDHYLRLQVHYEGIKAGRLTSLLKKVLACAEPVSTTAVILLTVCLGVIAFLQISDAGMILAAYGDTCRALPTVLPAL
jgi:hypothetical protein